METHQIIRALLDPSPGYVCRNLTDRASAARYWVPVMHRRHAHLFFDAPDVAGAEYALARLPELESVRQLRVLLAGGAGWGLGAPRLLVERPELVKGKPHGEQASMGSLLIFPAAEWELPRREFTDWCFDGVDAAFEGLPYTFDDIVLFAGVNFTPDRWFLVLRGPMAGKVCWWTHDGDSTMCEPWAEDIRAWADRVFADPPEQIFGGIIRFGADCSPDRAPEDSELYPIEYRAKKSP